MSPSRRRAAVAAGSHGFPGSAEAGPPTVGRARVATVLVVLCLALGGLVYRIVDVQATPDERILEEVSTPLGEIIVPAPRGTVLDRNGRAIALSLPAATVVADPRVVVDAEATAAALSELLGTPAEALLPSLTGDGAFRYVARQVDPEVGESVEELRRAGIKVISEPRREHPNGSCSALAAIGRVNVDHVGMSGIEQTYEEHLAGVPGRVVKEVGVDGTTIPGGVQEMTAATVGTDINVTLDRNVQFQTEQLLVEAVADARASSGVALVSIPATGEIVAMANVARSSDGIVACTRHNLAATWTYEPGSVFKPVTAAAVLSTGAASEQTAITVPSHLTIWEHRFEDTPTHGEVQWTPTQIVTRSSNIGAIRLAQLAGEETLFSTIEAFGFGSRTQLQLKGESRGIVLPLNQWSGLSLPNMAIGQGLAATPLQMLQLYSTLANGGSFVPLKLIVDDPPEPRPEPARVVGARTGESLLRMLTSVVAEGTGQNAAIEGFSVAGKTGTAWQPCDVGYACVNEKDELIGRHHTATFAGIVSNDDGPALVVLVVIDEPKGEHISGGRIAAPAMSKIAQYALRQLRIPAQSDAAPEERRRAKPAPVPTTSAPADPLGILVDAGGVQSTGGAGA